MLPRDQLKRFTDRMEVTLRENDYKGGWSHMTHGQIMTRIYEEIRELNEARKNLPWGTPSVDQINAVQKETIDTANFCMMLFDILDRIEVSK